jgi:hypothetical protein
MNALGFPDYSIVGTPDGGNEASIPINTNTADTFGSYWFLDGDVEGWDSPDMRVTMLTKIGSDVNAEGELPADLHYRGRSLVMKLYCEATSEINRQNSRLLLAQAANTSACVFTANEDVPKNLNVVRSGNTNQGKLTIAEKAYPSKAAGTYTSDSDPAWGLPVGSTVYVFEATVELYAMDPFKYAVIAETASFSGGTLSFANPGSYPSMNGVIHLTATGGGNGPIGLFLGGRVLQLLVPVVPASAPVLSSIPAEVTIDLYNQLIYDSSVGPGANYYYLRNMQTPWLRFDTDSLTMSVVPSQSGDISFYPAWL